MKKKLLRKKFQLGDVVIVTNPCCGKHPMAGHIGMIEAGTGVGSYSIFYARKSAKYNYSPTPTNYWRPNVCPACNKWCHGSDTWWFLKGGDYLIPTRWLTKVS